jgi:hypothetical protein
MCGPFEQIDHGGPFFLHGFEGQRRIHIQSEHRLVKQGHICSTAFEHLNRITGEEYVLEFHWLPQRFVHFSRLYGALH